MPILESNEQVKGRLCKTVEELKANGIIGQADYDKIISGIKNVFEEK